MNTEITNCGSSRPSGPHQRGLVLIVDDEDQNRTLLGDSLQAHGYEIEEAASGEEALQRIAARPPDVILLDAMMPKMDGFELCRCLKNSARTAAIPILMVTALSERKERIIAIAAGANDFLIKPVDLQDLTFRVRNAVQTKQLFDQLQAERETSKQLLFSILPKTIAERITRGEAAIAERHPDVTVLMAELVGFSDLCSVISPNEFVRLLDEVFSAFDILVEAHGLERIKTVEDAYLAAGGLNVPQTAHAGAAAQLALDMHDEIERLNHEYNTSVRIRIGISTGPVVAGVIGRKKLAYDVWGDTINLTRRLGTVGAPGTTIVGPATYERLKDRYCFQEFRTINLKGHGGVTAYELRAKTNGAP